MATGRDDEFQQLLDVGLNSDSLGEAPLAIEHLTRALEIAPNSAWVLQVHHWRADAYCRNEDHQSAIEDYKMAIGLAPDEAAGYFGAGFCLHHLGQNDMAIEYLNQAIRLEPSPGNYLVRGRVRHHQGAYQDAIRDLDQALHSWHIRPSTKGQINQLNDGAALYELGDIYFHRGLSHLALGDPRVARSDIENSVLYMPDFSESQIAMALVHVGSGDMGDAIHCLDEAFKLIPDDASVFLKILEYRSTIEGWLVAEAPTARDKASHSVEEFIFSVLKDIQ